MGLTRRKQAGTSRVDPGDRIPAEKIGDQPRSQAGRPTSAELERRKGRVMDVATNLFVTHGYAGTSLVDIAKGAGVATRTLYQHFGDKEDIFREVLFARDSTPASTFPVVEGDSTLFVVLMDTGRYINDIALRERSIQLMRLMISESNRFPELMKKLSTTIFSRLQKSVASIFSRLAALGIIPDGDHALSAELFTDFVLGNNPIMTYAGWRQAPPSDADLRHKVELFIVGRFGPSIARPETPASRKAKAGSRATDPLGQG